MRCQYTRNLDVHHLSMWRSFDDHMMRWALLTTACTSFTTGTILHHSELPPTLRCYQTDLEIDWIVQSKLWLSLDQECAHIIRERDLKRVVVVEALNSRHVTWTILTNAGPGTGTSVSAPQQWRTLLSQRYLGCTDVSL
jgi:hypothetical protein